MNVGKATRFFQPWINRVIVGVLALATTAIITTSITAVYWWRQAEQRACEAEYRASINPRLWRGMVRQADWCATLAAVRR